MRLVLIFLLLCVFTRLQAQQAWINELHYDNQGVDTLEFVEVLLTSVPDTTGWKLWLYDGVSGLPYDSVAAGEWLPGDSGSAYQLYLWYPKAIQNGPDAIAIAHYNTLIEFISYEGSVTATGGVAMGHTARDLSASQGSDPAGISMQLTGSGSAFEHFWWTNTESTAGQLNAGQQFTREPTLLLFGAACADFGQVPFGASSQPEAWVVAGANLSADPDLHLPEGFEWSQDADFSVSMGSGTYSLPRTADYYAPDTLYVRFRPGPEAGKHYADTLRIESGVARVSRCLKGTEGPFIEPQVWINELHYDNISTDQNEFVELVIALADLEALPHLALHFYNGNDQKIYKVSEGADWITGYEDPEGFLFLTAMVSGIQNGPNDGIALTHRARLLQFISYEGTLLAADGPAEGITSTDIGVMEEPDAPLHSSLQLIGTGGNYSDFHWAYFPGMHTMGAPNHDQVLPVRLSQYQVVKRTEGYWIEWTSNEEINHDHYRLQKSDDGVDYETFARIPPARTLPHTYRQAWPGKFNGYIRLVQADYDGHLTYYEPLRLPGHGESERIAVRILVSSVDGQVIKQTSKSSWELSLITEVMEDLKPGMYVIRIRHQKNWEILKVIKR